jgi:hypothetical protein
MLAVTAALMLGLTSCVQPPVEQPGVSVTSPPIPPIEDDLEQVLAVDFDEAAGRLAQGAPVADSSGLHLTGTITLGGEPIQPLQAVEGRDGMALRFAARCDSKKDKCPKGIVEFPSSAPLNPGARDFRFGASVLMTEEETSDGANVMQKGFNTGGRSQWKLQVDGDAGHPSCVVVGTEDDEEFTVTAKEGVADGEWHDVECARLGGSLVVSVDGVESNRKAITVGTVIEPPSAVRLGGKSVKEDNDQFFGVIDNVFVSVVRD